MLSVRFRFANRNEITELSVGKPSTNLHQTKPRSGPIGNSYLVAGGVAFRSVPHMGHFCAVPPGRMLFAIFEFVNGSFVVSFNSSYGSLLCGSWPHARIQKTVADEPDYCNILQPLPMPATPARRTSAT